MKMMPVALIFMMATCNAQSGESGRTARSTIGYRSIQAALVGSAAYDYVQTWRGLTGTSWREGGEASWFVSPRSAPKVVAFNVIEDAALLLAAHLVFAHPRSRRWNAVKIVLVAVISIRIVGHVAGGMSWIYPLAHDRTEMSSPVSNRSAATWDAVRISF